MNQMQNNFNTLESQLKDRIDSLERTLEASNRSAKVAEQALANEIERRTEKEKEQKNKLSEVTSERNNLYSEVAKLQDIISQMQQEREKEKKSLEQTQLLLVNAEQRNQEFLSNSVSNSVVDSLNNENKQLKEQLAVQNHNHEEEKTEKPRSGMSTEHQHLRIYKLSQ